MTAAAAGKLELAEEASEAVEHCLLRFPEMQLTNVIPHYHLAFRREKDNRLLIDGLRKAGLAE